MNQKLENRILYSLLALAGAYVVTRAWLLPITVDEASTAINHVPRRVVDTLLFETEANPNNHILNTLLIKILTGIFGWHHFVVRIPVLIGAGMYGWASLQLARLISGNSWVRIFSLLLLLGNPYLLEFFSFARGYGLAAGFMTMAIWQGWRFLQENGQKSLRNAALLAGLAVYSNFTLLVFWAPFIFLLFWACWQLNPGLAACWRQAKPMLKTTLVFILLWYIPLVHLSRSTEIVTWEALGSYFESVRRFIRVSMHANAYLGGETDLWITRFALAGAIACSAIAVFRWVQLRWQFKADPRVWASFILLGAVAANIAQVYLTHTPYLQPRLSLFYWPLFALLIACGAGWVNERFGGRKTWIMTAPVLLLLTINLVRTLDLRHNFEWFHDSDTFTVLDYLKKTYETEGRNEPYLIDTEWFMQNSFLFHLEKNTYGYAKYAKLPPFHGARPAMKEADFFYAVSGDRIQEASPDFEVVLRIPNNSMVLMRRKK